LDAVPNTPCISIGSKNDRGKTWEISKEGIPKMAPATQTQAQFQGEAWTLSPIKVNGSRNAAPSSNDEATNCHESPENNKPKASKDNGSPSLRQFFCFQPPIM
jgi:hypothetical protein